MTKILYVEDECDIRSEIVEELEDAGHKVAAAANGQEGLKLALTFRPDIIICDCLMPVMTGPEMLCRLRSQHEAFSQTPFVFLSAYADRTHKDSGLAAGADAYLTKPIDFEHLDAVVADLVGPGGKRRRLLTNSA